MQLFEAMGLTVSTLIKGRHQMSAATCTQRHINPKDKNLTGLTLKRGKTLETCFVDVLCPQMEVVETHKNGIIHKLRWLSCFSMRGHTGTVSNLAGQATTALHPTLAAWMQVQERICVVRFENLDCSLVMWTHSQMQFWGPQMHIQTTEVSAQVNHQQLDIFHEFARIYSNIAMLYISKTDPFILQHWNNHSDKSGSGGHSLSGVLTDPWMGNESLIVILY